MELSPRTRSARVELWPYWPGSPHSLVLRLRIREDCGCMQSTEGAPIISDDQGAMRVPCDPLIQMLGSKWQFVGHGSWRSCWICKQSFALVRRREGVISLGGVLFEQRTHKYIMRLSQVRMNPHSRWWCQWWRRRGIPFWASKKEEAYPKHQDRCKVGILAIIEIEALPRRSRRRSPSRMEREKVF